jgi:isoquinoline 1-oxidoreductase subunit beta
MGDTPIDCVVIVHRVGVGTIRGGIAMGHSEAFYGDIRIEGARVQLTELPRVDVHLILSEAKVGRVGETSVLPIARALTNAIFAAIDRTVRKLPIQLA